MSKLLVSGGTPLIGEVHINGSKNACLPIMAACLLTDQIIHINNVPNLLDINSMVELLRSLGSDIEFAVDVEAHKLIIECKNITNLIADYHFVSKMRASIIVLGPLLTRFGKAKVALPGGCAIGARSIDMHLEGLKLMGAEIKLENGYVTTSAPKGLYGAEIKFDKISVGATQNILTAATLAQGTTIIHNAACEPEVIDLCDFLTKMGAKISGVGTNTLIIEGVSKLSGCNHTLIPDRLEAGTFAIMAAATKGKLEILNCNTLHLSSLLEELIRSGIKIKDNSNSLTVYNDAPHINAISVQTAPFPYFPTDLQAPLMALMCLANGISYITENLFENRFMHVNELLRMGANIQVHDKTAVITGVKRLEGTQLRASDIRASVALITAALCANGESIIEELHHLDRGYEKIENKLTACGAKIKRVTDI